MLTDLPVFTHSHRLNIWQKDFCLMITKSTKYCICKGHKTQLFMSEKISKREKKNFIQCKFNVFKRLSSFHEIHKSMLAQWKLLFIKNRNPYFLSIPPAHAQLNQSLPSLPVLNIPPLNSRGSLPGCTSHDSCAHHMNENRTIHRTWWIPFYRYSEYFDFLPSIFIERMLITAPGNLWSKNGDIFRH